MDDKDIIQPLFKKLIQGNTYSFVFGRYPTFLFMNRTIPSSHKTLPIFSLKYVLNIKNYELNGKGITMKKTDFARNNQKRQSYVVLKMFNFQNFFPKLRSSDENFQKK